MISSPHLFSFTTRYDVLKIILEKGFRYSKWRETLPKSNFEQENFMVCFCDIPWNLNAGHRKCYGNNGMVMSKKWAIEKGISPVRYINSSSVGLDDPYFQRKAMHREYLEKNNYDFAEVLIGEIITEKFFSDGSLKNEYSLCEKFKKDHAFLSRYRSVIQDIENMESAIVKAGFKGVYEQFKGCINQHLEVLYDELEHRDAYVRNYSENFKHHSTGVHENKILYDEREWRAIKPWKDKFFTGKLPDFLSEEENLIFEDDDVVAILVEKKDYVDEVKDLIKLDTTRLLPTSADKVYFVEEYKE